MERDREDRERELSTVCYNDYDHSDDRSYSLFDRMQSI